MKYAYVENGVVTNMMWLYPHNESDFPTAVRTEGLPVVVGDTYEDGVFYHEGEKVISDLERAMAKIAEMEVERVDMKAALAELGVTDDAEMV